jgi:hypothetical protein
MQTKQLNRHHPCCIILFFVCSPCQPQVTPAAGHSAPKKAPNPAARKPHEKTPKALLTSPDEFSMPKPTKSPSSPHTPECHRLSLLPPLSSNGLRGGRGTSCGPRGGEDNVPCGCICDRPARSWAALDLTLHLPLPPVLLSGSVFLFACMIMHYCCMGKNKKEVGKCMFIGLL